MLSMSRLFYQARVSLPAFVLLLLPLDCVAHVKWFADTQAAHQEYAFSRIEIMVGVNALLLFLAVAKLLHDYHLKFGAVLSQRLTDSMLPFRIACVILAVYFLGCSISGDMLTPHVAATDEILALYIIAQAVISALLLFGRSEKPVAALIFLLFVVAGVFNHIFVFEYMLLMGLAWIVYFGQRMPNTYSIILLRITLGISLATLAMTEKLLQPELALNVLEQYPLNFTSYIGLHFTDPWFVLAAGVVELVVGLLLIIGWLTRITTLVVLGLMFSSNMFFVLIGNFPMALMELIGHLPVFAGGILLLFYCGESREVRATEQDAIYPSMVEQEQLGS